MSIKTDPQIPENYLAALDIGSNSFHFVYARQVDNHLQILYREKYPVKLALGLDDDHMLSEDAIARGIATLERLAVTTANLTADNFRVVATYSLRQAKNAKKFIQAARHVFPFDIEIISGHEEARLIYQGVAHNSAPQHKRLVIDIGGGSTECAIGHQFETQVVASLAMGCVSFHRQFFADGQVSTTQFERAIFAAKRELESIVNRFKASRWQQAIGTSGTIKTIAQLVNKKNSSVDKIKLKQLYNLQKTITTAKTSQAYQNLVVKAGRQDILRSGLAILIAIFEMLEITELEYCDYSLREGVLAEMLAIKHYHDVRQRTVDSAMQRFSVDVNQAQLVKQLATTIYQAVASAWQMKAGIYQQLLCWAALLHEVGMNINPSSYQRHGQYVVYNADFAGFNQEHQEALAWLIGNHRKKIDSLQTFSAYALEKQALNKICAILRLSVLLNQQRQLTALPVYKISAAEHRLNIIFPAHWLAERPLIAEDLRQEQQLLTSLDIELEII